MKTVGRTGSGDQVHIVSRQDLLIMAALVLTAGVVRWLFFSGGIRGSDAFAYAQYAYNIASGRYDLDAIRMFYGFRYTVLLPTALSYKVLGVGDLASGIFPILLSALNVGVVFRIGEMAFNREIALIASFLLVFYPLDIMSASVLGPDSFIPFLSAAALLCFLLGERESGKTRSTVWFVLAGCLIGLAYMARVSSIFLFFAFVIYQVFHKKIGPAVWTTVGLLLPLAAEALYFMLQTGDPLFEIHRITSPVIASAIKNDYDSGLLFYPKRMFGFDLEGLAFYGLTWWLVLGGILLAWKKREERMLLPAVCLFIPFFGFEFGFQSIKEGILITKNYGYLSLMTAPAMIIAGYLLFHTANLFRADSMKKKGFLLGVLFVLACMNLYGAYRLNLNLRNDAAPYIATADYLKTRPGSIVYTHHYRWPLFLRYFLKYDPSFHFRDLEQLNGRAEDARNVYVIFSRRYLEADVVGRAVPLNAIFAKYGDSPPGNWKKVVSFSGKPPYNSVDMYYIQP